MSVVVAICIQERVLAKDIMYNTCLYIVTIFQIIFSISIIYLLPVDAQGISFFSNKLQYHLVTREAV